MDSRIRSNNSFPRSTLADQVTWCTDLLRPVWRALLAGIIGARVMHLTQAASKLRWQHVAPVSLPVASRRFPSHAGGGGTELQLGRRELAWSDVGDWHGQRAVRATASRGVR